MNCQNLKGIFKEEFLKRENHDMLKMIWDIMREQDEIRYLYKRRAGDLGRLILFQFIADQRLSSKSCDHSLLAC